MLTIVVTEDWYFLNYVMKHGAKLHDQQLSQIVISCLGIMSTLTILSLNCAYYKDLEMGCRFKTLTVLHLININPWDSYIICYRRPYESLSNNYFKAVVTVWWLLLLEGRLEHVKYIIVKIFFQFVPSLIQWSQNRLMRFPV